MAVRPKSSRLAPRSIDDFDQLAQDRSGFRLQCSNDLDELNDTEATLAALVLGNERLRLTKALGYFCLRQALAPAELQQKSTQLLLARRAQGVAHGERPGPKTAASAHNPSIELSHFGIIVRRGGRMLFAKRELGRREGTMNQTVKLTAYLERAKGSRDGLPAEGYVAGLRESNGSTIGAEIRLPPVLVEQAVLLGSHLAVCLAPDGRVVLDADGLSDETLVACTDAMPRETIESLVTACIDPELLAGEDSAVADLTSLRAQLARALELVDCSLARLKEIGRIAPYRAAAGNTAKAVPTTLVRRTGPK